VWLNSNIFQDLKLASFDIIVTLFLYDITENRDNQELKTNIIKTITDYCDIILKILLSTETGFYLGGISTMALSKEQNIARAPGRICLLGDNVDLIEKPVLAAAISAFLSISIQIRSDDHIILIAEDIGFQEEFDLGDVLTLTSPLKYLEAVYQRLQSHVTSGFEATINSQIPVSAGMSSSTALCIAFIRALSQSFDIRLSTAEIAELSYVVERENLNIECGRMDQYAIAFGGVTYIDTGPMPGVESIPVNSLPIVVADTQDNHDTQQLQLWLQDRLRAGDKVLIDSLMRVVELVEQGKEALLQGDLETLGTLMSQQQIEENIMGTSTERLNTFCRTAMEAGAWGAKQMGAGGGGCVVVLCPPEKESIIQAALTGLGAPAWIFEIYHNRT
jgi:galactokinase